MSGPRQWPTTSSKATHLKSSTTFPNSLPPEDQMWTHKPMRDISHSDPTGTIWDSACKSPAFNVLWQACKIKIIVTSMIYFSLPACQLAEGDYYSLCSFVSNSVRGFFFFFFLSLSTPRICNVCLITWITGPVFCCLICVSSWTPFLISDMMRLPRDYGHWF